MQRQEAARFFGFLVSDPQNPRFIWQPRVSCIWYHDHMNKLILRALGPDEWQSYKALRLDALLSDPDSFGSTYAETAIKSDELWRTEFAPVKERKVFAEIDGDLVGMAGVCFERTDDGDVEAYLVGVYTKSAYRGQGIAAKLIQALIDDLRNDGEVQIFYLEVHQDAAGAIRLYESLGFVRGEPVPDFVRSDGAVYPKYLMSLRLR